MSKSLESRMPFMERPAFSLSSMQSVLRRVTMSSEETGSEEYDSRPALMIAQAIVDTPAQYRLAILMKGMDMASGALREEKLDNKHEAPVLDDHILVLKGLVSMVAMSIRDMDAMAPLVSSIRRQLGELLMKDAQEEKLNRMMESDEEEQD
jgi:hypothetical protein